MGKKTKKTKWRTLEISLPITGKNYHENGDCSGANLRWDNGWRPSSNKYRDRRGESAGCDKITKTSATFDVSEDNQCVKTLLEDEYTKITTPRQDVLFKKSYLTKRKTFVGAENVLDNDGGVGVGVTADGVAATMASVSVTRQDCANNCGEEFFNYENIAMDSRLQQPQLVCATSPPYMDASSTTAASAIYYGGGYEIYDPYIGNLATLVVDASSSANGVPCRPMPLQSLQWFNAVSSPSEWCGGAFTQHDDVSVTCTSNGIEDTGPCKASASYSSDSTNVSESSCTTESTTPTTGGDDVLYPRAPHSYLYPSYVIGTPVFSLEDDEVNLRYCSPTNPIFSVDESTAIKRKKKRKRRKRLADGEEDSESATEEYQITPTSDSSQNAYSDEHDGRRRCLGNCATISHASINAPPFVPAKFASKDVAQLQTHPQSQCVVNDRDRDRVSRYNDEKLGVVENGVVRSVDSSPSSSFDSSEVGRASFTAPIDDRNKLSSDSTPSSSNSDSGISSPGSGAYVFCTDRQHATKTPATDRSQSIVRVNVNSPATIDVGKKKKATASETNDNDNEVDDKVSETLVERKMAVERGTDQLRSTSTYNECKINEKDSSHVRRQINHDETNANPNANPNRNLDKLWKKSIKISNESRIVEPTSVVVNESANSNNEKGPSRISACFDFEENAAPTLQSRVDKLDRNTHVEAKVDDICTTMLADFTVEKVIETSASRHSAVALVAQSLVDEIVQHATTRIRMSMATEKCDKLRLPLTQAVTNWMNERGGLPAATGFVPQSSDSRVTNSTATKHCVIC